MNSFNSHRPPDPSTATQAKRIFSNDKIKQLVKLKVQIYIESFFKKMGKNRNLLSAISPQSLNYNIDKSFDPQLDPTQRKLQIARYVNEIKNIIPAILVADGGVIPYQQSIGLRSRDESDFSTNTYREYYTIFRRVPIKLVLASRDMETGDQLSSVISLLFNELRNLAGGSCIEGNKEEGERYTIFFQNEPVAVSGLSETEVPNDPTERIFYAEADFDVYYEDVIKLESQIRTAEFINDPFVNDPDVGVPGQPFPLPQILVDDQIPLNKETQVIIKYPLDSMKVYLSDGRYATLTPLYKLSPRRLGKFKIYLESNGKVLVQKEIEVV